MELFIPPEIADLEPALKRFFDAMIYKLRKHAGKGRWEAKDLDKIQELLVEEVGELAEAIQEGNQIETVLEAADVANYAMIAAAIAIEGVNNVKEPEV